MGITLAMKMPDLNCAILRKRERTCSAGSAGLCDGSERDMQVCNDEPCYDWPNKGWTDWTSWGSCSKSCGGGTRERRRTCKAIDNICGDESESDYQVAACNEDACPTNKCAKEIKINLDQTYFHTQEFWRYSGLYHRTEDNSVDQACCPYLVYFLRYATKRSISNFHRFYERYHYEQLF